MNYRIFQFLLLLFVAIPCLHINAQRRVCDLEAICMSPADTVLNGGALPLRFGRKNLGPDIMFKNDTTFYRIYRVVDGKEKGDYAGAFGGRKNDTVKIGDSTIYADNYTIRFNYPDLREPLVLDYCVQIDSWKQNAWGDTIGFSYYDDNKGNNSCCKQVVVVPLPSTHIAVSGADERDVVLYPNPAKDMLYIKMEQHSNMGSISVIVRDIRGVVLLKHDYRQQHKTAMDGFAIDVRWLPAGMYTLSVQSRERIITRKFVMGKD